MMYRCHAQWVRMRMSCCIGSQCTSGGRRVHGHVDVAHELLKHPDIDLQLRIRQALKASAHNQIIQIGVASPPSIWTCSFMSEKPHVNGPTALHTRALVDHQIVRENNSCSLPKLGPSVITDGVRRGVRACSRPRLRRASSVACSMQHAACVCRPRPSRRTAPTS
jgi:hypothetical protein